MITRVRPAGVLVGYAVEAVDGPVGTIDRGTYDTGRLVVKTRGGAPVTLPVDAVHRIDHRRRTVYLGVSRASVSG
ncbi:hypothetical protein GCM10009827_001010 [Dactylosporangium maewongense]|uniref:PRC-barrel domain-containing protein n=1 Tax=Dactylosporangium maewongense TaxID=634393 RepID=A0ABN1ZHS0_9ACTN